MDVRDVDWDDRDAHRVDAFLVSRAGWVGSVTSTTLRRGGQAGETRSVLTELFQDESIVIHGIVVTGRGSLCGSE